MNLLLYKMAGQNEKEGYSCPRQDYDDDIAMISSTESLDLEYQMTMKFNKLLPYADELEKEATKLLSDIKGELGRAVALRKYYPDCNLAVMKLASYIKLYNLRFTKEDHILFIKLMYELIIVEDQDIDLIQTFAGTLGLLLKKPKTLSPSDIELPWRPLYELSRKLTYVSYSKSGMYRCCTGTVKIINWATGLARNYFPLSATQEILDELRPMICPLMNPSTNKAIATLEFLLPLSLPPELHHVGFHLWFDELMTLWNTCINETAWQNSMMSLMSKLAAKNIGYINWEPHIPIMFTRFVRSLNLPVYYKNNKGGRLYKIETIPIATWIVSVLGGNSSCQMHLEKFLKTIETYFYQANSGPWAGKLKDLVCKIVIKFINRLHSEKYPKITWETPVPDSHKLTNADIDAFVKSIMPIAMTSMFGHTGIDQIDWVFRILGMIRPSMIIPDVIERMFSTLDSLTEPHKLTAAMSAITALARPLVQGRRHACKHYSYNDGPSRVLPLLMSSLPGIDGNDLIKTFATFHLISVYTALVPMIDCSHAKMDMLNDEDRLVCQDTAQFEDFVLQFFERIFSLIESSTLDYVAHDTKESNLKSRIEKTTEMVLGSTCLILLLKTSSDIYQTALHKLKIFITERVLETRISGPLAATVCRSFAEINGKETLKALLPPLIDTIMELVKEGDVTKDEHPDIRFMYALQLIGPLVDVKGEDLLAHIDTLIELLDKVIYIESSEGNMLTADILRNLLNALGRISISSHYTCYGKDYNNPNYPYILDWGKGADIKDIDFQWCIPGEDEIGAMQKIFNRYLLVEVDRIKRYIAGDSTINRNNLATSLGMIDAILNGCILYLPVLDDDSRKPAHELMVCIGVEYEIKMPNGDNVHETMVKLLTDLQEVLLTTNADDTKSLKNLSHLWGILLLGKYIDKDNHKNEADSIKLMGGEIKDYYVNKRKHLAECILERIQLQHNIRIHSNYYSMRKIHEHILLQLFKLATSTYAAVRCAAQSVLSLAQSYFTSMCNVLQPKIMELLEKDPDENHEEIKGLYYVLLGPRKDPLISVNNWNFRKNVWLGIVRAKPSEKLSIIKLRNAICDEIYVALNPPINMKLPDSAIKIAKELWNTSPRPSYSLPSDEEIEEAHEDMKKQIIKNQENYDKLVDNIVSAIEINCHWRQKLLGITCLNRLAYIERPYTPRCINFFLNTLIHGSSEERELANPSVITILRQHKRPHKKIKITSPKIPDNATWGIRPDNLWLQYNYKNRPKSEARWNNNRYVHLSYIGYYTWPKEIEIYAPYNEQPSLDKDRILTQSEKIIEDFFCNLDNITKIIRYNYYDCRKGKDKFLHVRFQLFKSLFRNLGIKPLSNILSCLYVLLENDEDGGQHCAAEIIAGLIRGSKHWPYEMTVCMWENIRPVIKIGLNKMTSDTAKDWSICFGQSTKNRDPNRQWWLLEYLMKERADTNITSLRECQKLNMIYAALNKQSWRVTELNVKLLDRLERRLLSNPFQNIRDSLGNLLSLIFCNDIDQPAPPGFSIPSARDFMNRYVPQILKLGDIDTAQLENHKQEIILAETIFKWITARGFSSPQGTLPCSARLLPVLCQLENYDGDGELRATCLKTLATLAQAQALPPVIGELLDEISKVFNMNSWSSRTAALNFIEVFVFHHMAVIICKPEWVSMIQEIVINSLEDERVEVREKAGQVLGGLLHCEFVPEQELLLGKFEKKSKIKIKSPDDLRLRHAGVLGLCAFIMAHPYDVPQYMPSIFEYLSFCLNDPQPIPTTIRKTLGNFKRTHYDGWSSHAQAFTEEQLAILQDLTVPPSHYA